MESLAVNLPSGFDGVEEAGVAPVKKRKLISVTTPDFVIAKAVTPTRKIYAEAEYGGRYGESEEGAFVAYVYEMKNDIGRVGICSVEFTPEVGSTRVNNVLRGIVNNLRRYYQHKLNNKARNSAKMEAAHA